MAKCLLMCWFSCGEAENPKKTGRYGRDNGDNQLENRLLNSMAKAVFQFERAQNGTEMVQ